VLPVQPTRFLARLRWYTRVSGFMHLRAAIFGHKHTRRALAIAGCVVLLYFAAGGSLHHHTSGPETACHICQALHMPALAVAPARVVPEAQQAAWHVAVPQHRGPSDSFGLHRASRAPPAL
jgi:hypothetical protein